MTLVTGGDTLRATGLEIRVLADRCDGCEECLWRCPTGALSLEGSRWLAEGDADRCVGCRQCERACPAGAIVVTGPLVVAGRAEEGPHGFSSWRDVVAEAARCLACPDPGCVLGCPGHADIPGIVAAVYEGDLAMAHEILRRASVTPDVCSRACDQASPCEGACTWALAGGEPVSIGRIERFVGDNLAAPPSLVRRTGAALSVTAAGRP